MDYWRLLYNSSVPSTEPVINARRIAGAALRSYVGEYSPSMLYSDIAIILLLCVTIIIIPFYGCRHTIRACGDCYSLLRITSTFVPRLMIIGLLLIVLIVAYSILCDIWAFSVADYPEEHAMASTALVHIKQSSLYLQRSFWANKP